MILTREQKADLVIMDDDAAKKTAKFLGFNPRRIWRWMELF